MRTSKGKAVIALAALLVLGLCVSLGYLYLRAIDGGTYTLHDGSEVVAERRDFWEQFNGLARETMRDEALSQLTLYTEIRTDDEKVTVVLVPKSSQRFGPRTLFAALYFDQDDRLERLRTWDG